jgi:heat shock protein HslJ
MTTEPVPLEGVEWRLAAYLDASGAEVPVPDGVVATAEFADGFVGGSTGCNRYRAPYRDEGSTLEIGPAAMTMMACDPERTAVERAFTASLAAAVGWAGAGDTLDILDGAERVTLRFRASAGPALVGTTWVAIAINNGRGAVVSAVEGVRVTAVFGADGRITGSGGCNRFFGPYSAEESSMEIGPLASTRMACPEGRVGEQEAAYFAALERVATWSIREDRLQLRSADGALEADFRPVEAG